ncbi:hypothetical protein [Fibrobacter succinogenes]|uniref:Uncharacterized protein n=1 Tax=Fibrobacter succinogenes TaxID=833 RepID=A0A380S5X7_FIBSU|nr:hypothetical protein [Fibrobacter succinogenes]PWJ35890.1 hypothetical protein IE02_1951 [Fibrobacter succinogenes subsp. elongatus]SUQ24545.1 hypothetical protein SAMN05661053_1951 [Fibrobacter succinogenes]
MSEGEKNQFNGNLALFRVCVIVFIANLLNFVVNMCISAGHGGFFSSLWSALTNSSFEDLLATVGLLVASGVGLVVLLGVLAFAVLLALGIFALVKKSVKALKILAVLFLIWVMLCAFAMNPISGLLGNEMREVNLAQSFISLIFNINVVVAVAAFFVTSEKQDLLLRLCAICFAVSGLNSLSHFIFTQLPVFQLAFFGVVYLAVGVFALVKKNVPVLMVGSLMIFIQILLNLFNFIRISGLDLYIAVSLVAHTLFHTSTVIAIAVFFIKPEWVKSFLQKIKG